MKQKIKIIKLLSIAGFVVFASFLFNLNVQALPYGGSCDDGDLCTTDSFNNADGQCENIPKDCSDTNACTVNETCNSATGQCESSPLKCPDGEPAQCKNYTCNPASGCVVTNMPNGSSCNGSGVSCSITSFACNNGSCSGSGGPYACTASRCNLAGTCIDTPTGPNGCTTGPAINVDDGDACTKDSCDENSGIQNINQPVDGGWSDPICGEWSSCSGNPGTRSRTCTKQCNNPAPSCEGDYCPGSNSETQTEACGQCTANEACGSGSCTGTQYCTNGVLSSCDYSASNGGSCDSGNGVCANGTCNPSPVCGNGVTEGNETCDQGSANNGACPKTCGSNCQTNTCISGGTGGSGGSCASNETACGSNCCNDQSQICNAQTLTCVNKPVVNCLSANDCDDNNPCTSNICGSDGKCDNSQGTCYKCSTTPSTNGFGHVSYCKQNETSGQGSFQSCSDSCTGGSGSSFVCNNTCFPSTAFGACRQLNTNVQCIESSGGQTHYYRVTYTGTVCDGFSGNPVDPSCTTSGCACVQTSCTYSAQQNTPGVWNSDVFSGSCAGSGSGGSGGTVCGNLVTEAPTEQCDDGNVANGDGCSASCQIENSITINSIPVSQDVVKGNSAVYAIKSTYSGASIANAKFTVSNCPSGSTCTFGSGSNTQTTAFNSSKLASVILTVTSGSNSAVANNTLNVKVENAVCAGQSGCLSANTNINFNVLNPTVVNASSCLGDVTAPDAVNAGASFNYSVTTKNVGSSTWHNGSNGPNVYGITAWPRNVDYVFGDQVTILPTSSVLPNNNITFNGSVTAPTNPPAKGCTQVGNNLYSCPLSLRMWQHNVGWFGPICNKNINVSVAPPTVNLTINDRTEDTLSRGGSGTFRWTTSDANNCVSLGSQGTWSTQGGGQPLMSAGATGSLSSGSVSTGSLSQPGWWQYSISCSNNFGVTNDSVWVFVPDCNEPPSLISSSVTPATVAPGGSYSIGCNYGVQPTTTTINPVPSSGTCSFMGWSGTGANFACTAPTTPNTYPNLCTIGTNNLGQANTIAPHYYCKRDSGINSTVVSAGPPPTVVLQANNQDTSSGSPLAVPRKQSTNVSLSWTVTNATSCTASKSTSAPGTFTGDKNYTSGSEEKTAFITPGVHTYTLTCTGAGGTASDTAYISVPQCNATTFVGGSVSPATLTLPNTSYTLTCDYGVNTNQISPVVGSGSCAWSGNWNGTSAVFNCTAGNTPNTYTNSCRLVPEQPDDYYCASTNAINNLVIQQATTPPPTNLSAVLATCPSRNVNLTWASGGGSGATYNVYRSTSNNNNSASASLVQGSISALSFTDTPSAGSSYNYWVSASINGVESTRVLATGSPVAVTACAGNGAPVAVAKISTYDGGYQKSITVTKGVPTRIYLSADESDDPNGWGDNQYGMDSGTAKCEWNYDLDQSAFSVDNTVSRPSSRGNCDNFSENGSYKTFNDTPGTYTYQVLRLTDKPGAVSNIDFVQVTVQELKPTIVLSPTSFVFNAVLNGSKPPAQDLRITNTGSGALNWTFERTGNDPWCNLLTASGTNIPVNSGGTILANGGYVDVKVSVNDPTVEGSFSNCGIRIKDANATNSPQDAGVTYNVSSASCPVGTVSLSASTINPGQTVTASAPSGFSGGSFASSNLAVATVSGTTISGVSTGTSNISGTGFSHTGGATNCALASATLTVNNAPPTTGTINVRYALDNSNQAGSVNINYGISGPSPVASGSYAVSVSSSHPNSQPGSYTLTYNSGGPANALIDPNTPITPSVTQSLTAGSSITYTFNFLSKPAPVCPTGSCCPGGDNSSTTCGGGGGSGGGYTGVACKTIKINWTDGSTNEDGFYVYANQTGTAPATAGEKTAQRVATVTTTTKAGTGQAYTYTFSAPNTNPYYFWVSAYNNAGGAGESALMPMSNNPISANDCTANIVSSDKDMITVAGVNPTATACNGSAEGTYLGATPIKFFGGNLITFAINVCNNNNSFYDAKDVIVTDYLTNLKKPATGWNTKQCTGGGGSGTCTNLSVTEAGTSPNQTLTFSLQNVLIGEVKSILVTAEIAPAPLGSTSRFNNRAIIDYKKEDGSRSNRQASTPWLPYFSATSTPSRIEIPGR